MAVGVRATEDRNHVLTIFRWAPPRMASPLGAAEDRNPCPESLMAPSHQRRSPFEATEDRNASTSAKHPPGIVWRLSFGASKDRTQGRTVRYNPPPDGGRPLGAAEDRNGVYKLAVADKCRMAVALRCGRGSQPKRQRHRVRRRTETAVALQTNRGLQHVCPVKDAMETLMMVAFQGSRGPRLL